MDPEEHQRLDKEFKRLWIRYGLALIPAGIPFGESRLLKSARSRVFG